MQVKIGIRFLSDYVDYFTGTKRLFDCLKMSRVFIVIKSISLLVDFKLFFGTCENILSIGYCSLLLIKTCLDGKILLTINKIAYSRLLSRISWPKKFRN